jgi:hypothetical protein
MQIVAECSNTNDRLSSRNVASAGFNYFVAALNLDLRLNSTTADLVALGGWRITCLWGQSQVHHLSRWARTSHQENLKRLTPEYRYIRFLYCVLRSPFSVLRSPFSVPPFRRFAVSP